MVCEQSYQSYRVNQVQFTDPLSGSVRSLVDFFIGDSLVRHIPLTQGKFAVVDDEDYDWLMQWKWFAVKRKGGFVAVRNSSRTQGKRKKILMHRLIMDCPDTLQIDHIHHVTLDNRKTQLRTCSNQENARNRIPYKHCSSRFKGVYWVKQKQRWRARIIVDDHHQYLGLFVNEIDAAKAYNKRAIELFGEFAYPNLI